LTQDLTSGAYRHMLSGLCDCGQSHDEALERIRAEIREQFAIERSTYRVVAEYEYRDEHGELLFVVERRDPKAFCQRRPDGEGGWVWNIRGIRRVLYRLPDLIAAMRERPTGERIVHLPEGERDVESLRQLGLVGTCNAMGAGKWTDDYAVQLVQAGVEHVVVFGDNDQRGERHADQVTTSCRAAGMSVRRVRLPGLPPVRPDHGEDVTAWLGMDGHTAEELLQVIADADDDDREPADDGLGFVSLGDFYSEPDTPTAWLVEDRLPEDGSSIFAGKPKAGKSTSARTLARAVARGEPWLGGATRQGAVLYFAPEERRAEVRAHFRAMGLGPDDPVYVSFLPAGSDGIARLRRDIARYGPVLVIVDTLARLVKVKDLNDYAQVTAALEPLVGLAREFHCHVMLVHHQPKGDRTGVDAVLGSSAISASVDSIFLLQRTDRYRTLRTIQRYGEDLDESTVVLDPTTKLITLGSTRREVDEVAVTHEMLAFLASREAPVGEQVIIDHIEGRQALKRAVLRRLVDDNRVLRTGLGQRGSPYLYGVPPVEAQNVQRTESEDHPRTPVEP
jgi:hypothetical protein